MTELETLFHQCVVLPFKNLMLTEPEPRVDSATRSRYLAGMYGFTIPPGVTRKEVRRFLDVALKPFHEGGWTIGTLCWETTVMLNIVGYIPKHEDWDLRHSLSGCPVVLELIRY